MSPGVAQCFGTPVDGIQFDPLDSLGNSVDLAGQFLFGVGFATTGNFAGSLVAIRSVPEPASWTLMIVGFALIGFIRRLTVRRNIGSMSV